MVKNLLRIDLLDCRNEILSLFKIISEPSSHEIMISGHRERERDDDESRKCLLQIQKSIHFHHLRNSSFIPILSSLSFITSFITMIFLSLVCRSAFIIKLRNYCLQEWNLWRKWTNSSSLNLPSLSVNFLNFLYHNSLSLSSIFLPFSSSPFFYPLLSVSVYLLLLIIIFVVTCHKQVCVACIMFSPLYQMKQRRRERNTKKRKHREQT